MNLLTAVLTSVDSARLHFPVACRQAILRSVDMLTRLIALLSAPLSIRDKIAYSVYTSTHLTLVSLQAALLMCRQRRQKSTVLLVFGDFSGFLGVTA